MTEADALFARALTLEDAGQPERALEHYRRVLALAPAHPDAWHNHGLLLARLGRLEEAERSHRSYVEAHPGSARARADLADVLLALGRYEPAIETLDAVPAAGAESVPLMVRRGVAQACLRRFDEARESFALARSRDAKAVMDFLARLAPGADPQAMLCPENIYLWRCYRDQGRCDWAEWDAYVAEMRAVIGKEEVALEPAVAFMAFHLPLSGAERHALASKVSERIAAKAPVLPAAAPRRGGRIRVGVLSPDLREHLNAYLLLPLFELLDRERFEVHAYSLASDDGSAIRARVRSAADGFRDLHALPDREAALAISEDGIDILLDAAGHTTGGRFAITAQRPARVQAAYLGFAGSFGSKRVDYAIADRVAGCDESEWSEQLVHLPSTYFLYDFRDARPKADVSRAAYGLPASAFVYCAFHKPEKITPDAFGLWMEVLAQVPHAVLWLLSMSPEASGNLRAHAAARGVDPSRLHFAPFDTRERYLARQALGDLLLDAIHHSAMTTACDALGAGMPLLTVPGAAFAGRAGESLLRAAGLPELVAAGPRAYVESAVRLALEPGVLAGYQARLVRGRRAAPLFDTAGRVRELEAAFERMLAPIT